MMLTRRNTTYALGFVCLLLSLVLGVRVGHTSNVPPSKPHAQVELAWDDGSAERVTGHGDGTKSYPAVWLNTYSLARSELPVRVNTVRIMFPAAADAEGSLVGKQVRVLVYHSETTYSDITQSQLLYESSATISQQGSFQDFPVDALITTPGVLYVGWEDQWAEGRPEPQLFVAALDASGINYQSYVYDNRDGYIPSFRDPAYMGDGYVIEYGDLLIRAVIDTNVPGITTTPTSTATPQPTFTATPTATERVCEGERFKDVCPDDYFYAPVLSLNDRAVVSGYGTSPPCTSPTATPCFRPYSNVTRGQAAKMVVLASGITTPDNSQVFEDVQPGDPFYTEITTLAQRGYIGGYPCGGAGEPCFPPDNRAYFRPGSSVTRGQLAKIAANTADYSEAHSEQAFEDVPPGSPFFIWIARLAARGHIIGYACGQAGEPCVGPSNKSYFRPNASITRGQTAKIVYGVWPNPPTTGKEH